MQPQPIPVERPKLVLPPVTPSQPVKRPGAPPTGIPIPSIRRQPPSPPTHVALYRRIATAFLVLTGLVALFVVYVIFSKATVTVMSAQEEARTEFSATVSRTPTDGELPGAVLTAEKEISREFPTAVGAKADAPAEGRVRIASTLSRSQTLVATTRLLLPDNRLYRIKENVVVPANGSVEVDAYADAPGTASEITEGEFTIPGLNPETRSLFKVTVVRPFTGGQREGRFVTSEDVAAAVETLKSEATTQLTEELREQAKAASAGNAGESVSIEVASQEVAPAVGEAAEKFIVTVKVKGVGVFFDRERLAKLASAKLKEAAPFDRMMLPLVGSSLDITVGETDLNAGRASLKVSVSGASVLSPDAPALDPSRLAGISKTAAEDYLKKTPGISSVSIRVRPFWSGRMPDVAEHIKVEVR
ncbi:MAG: hypothetical protein PHT12_00720 [Patescibacteria group bacterium]|nr:hypothetical protein [Patescibacteria group bacterium]